MSTITAARAVPGEEGAATDSRAAFARNALALLAGQVASTALAIVLSAALGRSLGADDFGVYYLITTLAAFAYVFAEWGQPLFVIRAAAREPPRSGELLGSALALRAAFTLAVTVPAGLATWALGYGARTTGLAVALMVALLPMFLAQGYGMVFRARDRMGREAAVSVFNKAMGLGLTLPALALGVGLAGFVAAQAVAGVAALALAVHFYRRLGAPSLRVSSRVACELMAAGAPILAMSATIALQPYLDAVILTKLAPAAAVGWYGAARIIMGTLTAPAIILATAAYPRLVRASGTPGLPGEVRAALRPLLALAALAGAGTYLFAGTVVDLVYGSAGFGPTATILEVFAPGFFLLFLDVLLGHIIYASGHGTGFAVAKILSVAAGTTLNLLLIPVFQRRYGNGGIGVVVAFALSELIVFAGALLALRRGTFRRVMALDFARALGAAATTVLVVRAVPAPPWIALPLCLAVFAAASLALGLVGGGDLARFGALLRRPRAAAPTG
jgi:O-antigen/teichoic acid export membrane protein